MKEEQQVEEEEESSCSSSSKDFNPCPICLGPFRQEAYLDRCFHKFCYNCIARWAKFVADQQSQPDSLLKCPFCKSDNFSIIYGCDGDSFQQHYINKDPESSRFFSKAHKQRLQTYYREPAAAIYEKFDFERYWKLRRYLQPNKWLQTWLRREIQALTQVEDADIIVHHILGVVESLGRRNEREQSKETPIEKRAEFRVLVSDAARPFLIGRTERFVNEVEVFLTWGLNIEAYDKVYFQSLELTSDVVTGEEERRHEQTTQAPILHFFEVDSDME